jgi:hypothetical protein
MSTNDRSHEIIMNALREAALARSATEHPESACLSEYELVAFADGQLADGERLALTPHLSSCRRCQHDVASLVRALNDPEIIRAARLDRSYLTRLSAFLIPLAAAAAIVVAITLPRERRMSPPAIQHREPAITPVAAPTIDGPVGAVSEVDALRWSAVPHADLYRVTLFDGDGNVLFEEEAAAPSAALPDSVKLLPAKQYLWQVQARIGFDRWVSSDLVEFRVVSQLP